MIKRSDKGSLELQQLKPEVPENDRVIKLLTEELDSYKFKQSAIELFVNIETNLVMESALRIQTIKKYVIGIQFLILFVLGTDHQAPR